MNTTTPPDTIAEAATFLETEAMRYAATSPRRIEMLACAARLRAMVGQTATKEDAMSKPERMKNGG